MKILLLAVPLVLHISKKNNPEQWEHATKIADEYSTKMTQSNIKPSEKETEIGDIESPLQAICNAVLPEKGRS